MNKAFSYFNVAAYCFDFMVSNCTDLIQSGSCYDKHNICLGAGAEKIVSGLTLGGWLETPVNIKVKNMNI